MRLDLTYKLADGTADTVTAVPFVIIQWERKFKTKVSKLADDAGLEDLLYLAWEAARFAGRNVPASFDDFARQVVEVGNETASAADPFDAAATATSLP